MSLNGTELGEQPRHKPPTEERHSLNESKVRLLFPFPMLPGVYIILLMVQKSHSQPPGMFVNLVNNGISTTKLNWWLAGFVPSTVWTYTWLSLDLEAWSIQRHRIQKQREAGDPSQVSEVTMVGWWMFAVILRGTAVICHFCILLLLLTV